MDRLFEKKKFLCYKNSYFVDVEFEDESYNAGNKLNSFFGQIGVYENPGWLLNLINSFYKNLDFSFSMFRKRLNFKKDEDRCEVINEELKKKKRAIFYLIKNFCVIFFGLTKLKKNNLINKLFYKFIFFKL